MDVDGSLPNPNAAMVAEVAGRLTGRAITDGTYVIERLHGGFGASIGVFRLTGRTDGAPWSVVLKVLGRTPSSSALDRWDRWDREAEAYRHEVGHRLPAGLSAPRCAGVVEVDGDTRWIWLEDVDGGTALGRSIEDHAEIARLLGQFNGSGLITPDCSTPGWYSQRWLRGWVEECAEAAAGIASVASLPLVERTWPAPVAARLAGLWADRERYLAMLDRLPQALCHHDVFHANLAGQRSAGGTTERVLLDWAFVGQGALGEELVALIHVSLLFGLLSPDQVEEAERRCLSAYVDGLRSTRWEGDERLPRLGYAAAGALRYSVGTLRQWLPIATGQVPAAVAEALMGVPLAVAAHNIGNETTVALRLADEAVQLASALGIA